MADSGTPLSDAELDRLERYLARIPAHREPFDLCELDGFLTAVLVHPEALPPSRWMPYLLDSRGRELELPWTRREHGEFVELVMRRYHELAYAIAERIGFDPIVYPLLDEDTGEPMDGPEGVAALDRWAGGFVAGAAAFPGLLDRSDPVLAAALAGVLRHLPADDGIDAQLISAIDAATPLDSLDDAIELLVGSVMAIADVTRPRQPLRRAAPKVGRNEPCPCGSGRKYKICCAAGAH